MLYICTYRLFRLHILISSRALSLTPRTGIFGPLPFARAGDACDREVEVGHLDSVLLLVRVDVHQLAHDTHLAAALPGLARHHHFLDRVKLATVLLHEAAYEVVEALVHHDVLEH